MNRVVSLKQKKGMPEYGAEVCVYGSDCFGWWMKRGSLKPFIKPPFKNSPPHRFVDVCGSRINDVEYWSADALPMRNFDKRAREASK